MTPLQGIALNAAVIAALFALGWWLRRRALADLAPPTERITGSGH